MNLCFARTHKDNRSLPLDCAVMEVLFFNRPCAHYSLVQETELVS